MNGGTIRSRTSNTRVGGVSFNWGTSAIGSKVPGEQKGDEKTRNMDSLEGEKDRKKSLSRTPGNLSVLGFDREMVTQKGSEREEDQSPRA